MFKKKKILIVVALVLLVSGITIFYVDNNAVADQNKEITTYQKFVYIVNLVKEAYVDDVDVDKLLTGAIDGMLESLDDPYTVYLPSQDYEEMQEEFSGNYGGIGIYITMKDKQLTVVSPLEGTPGERAKLQPEDMIVAIDGVSTKDMAIKNATKRMKGKPGTEVTLTIKRELNNSKDSKKDDYKEFDVKIIREKIEVSRVESEMKEDKIGYILLTQFIEGVGEDVATEIDKLEQEGAEGIILDLRYNPGGLLTEAIKVASNFIEEGVVVYSEERGKSKKGFSVDAEIEAIDSPLVILVNKGSASASEIVTGAIQDHQRGTIIGTQTFGKGIVQSVMPFTDGSALKITTAKYYTPEGRFIHHEGIKPNIEVKYDPETKSDEQLNEAIQTMKELIKTN